MTTSCHTRPRATPTCRRRRLRIRTGSSPRCASASPRSGAPDRSLPAGLFQVDQEVERDVTDVVDAHVAAAEAPLAVDLLELVSVVAVDDRPQRLVARL